MSFTVNREVTTASAMLQSCMLVLSDETTKIQAVDHDREASINENQKPKFSSQTLMLLGNTFLWNIVIHMSYPKSGVILKDPNSFLCTIFENC